MEKKFDVVALGELLVDMAEGEKSSQGNMTFEACPGGAPCNVLSLLSKAGHKTAFIGKVGDDFLGHMLVSTIEEVGICSEGVIYDKDTKTTLAFVHKKEDGDRDFSFYRNPGADMMLKEDEVSEELISSSSIFHFGTLSMTSDDVTRATLRGVELARKHGLLVSFDPNLREPLWDSLETARWQILWGIKNCDVLKISDNEVEFVTGCEDMMAGLEELKKISSARIIFVTLGKDGCIGWAGGENISVPGTVVSEVVDTTGAGDTFMGTALHYILEYGLNISDEQLFTLLTSANKTAAKITAFKGALKVMPEIEK